MYALTQLQHDYLMATIKLAQGPCGPPTRSAIRDEMGKQDASRHWDKHLLLSLAGKGFIRRAPYKGSVVMPLRTPEGSLLRWQLTVEGGGNDES